MAKFHSIPTKRLAESITASDTSFSIRTNTDWNGVALNPADFDAEEYGVFRNETNTKLEFFCYDATDIGNGNLTIVRRGLDYNGDLTTEITDNKKNWIKGETLVELGSDPAQLFQWLKEYIDNGLNAGASDATDAIKGIVEIATNTEIDAGTTAGSTGARLVVPADARNNLSNDEKDALAAGGDFGTPSTSNKFQTERGVKSIGAFGDGSDGDVTISSETTLTRDMHYNNLTVNATLITNGYRIFVKNTINGSGTIKYPDAEAGEAGQDVDGNFSGSNGLGGASNGVGFFPNRAGTNGGSDPSADTSGALANAGGKSGTAGGRSAPTNVPENNPGIPFVEEFNYGLGISPVWGLDMQDDGTVAVYKAPSGGQGGQQGIRDNQSGGGGQGGPGGAGGGGASGGVVWIVARNWEGTFTIRAIGGDGGDAGNSQNGYYIIGETTPGAGGAGGVAVIFYQTKSWTGTYNLAGGTKGADDGGSWDQSATGASEDGPDGVSYEIKL